MDDYHHPPPLDGDAQERISEGDRLFFEKHPERRFRVRPLDLDEVEPGFTFTPGARTVVVNARPGFRFRFPTLSTPPGLRHDNDRTAVHLLRRAPARECPDGDIATPLEFIDKVMRYLDENVPHPESGGAA